MFGKNFRKWRLKKDLTADLRANPAPEPPDTASDSFLIRITENVRLRVDEDPLLPKTPPPPPPVSAAVLPPAPGSRAQALTAGPVAATPPAQMAEQPAALQDGKVRKLPARVEQRAKRFPILRFTLYVFMFLFFFGFGSAFHLLKVYLVELPDPEELIRYEPDLGAKFLSDDGSVVGEVFEYKREIVKIDDVPQLLKDAVVAIEDTRFYDHKGVDFIGIARALYHDIRERKLAQGGSTITQQVAKLVVTGSERTFKRKVREALIALKMELRLSKDEIMEIYLNQAWFGSTIHGVKAAAKHYFNKELADLTAGECAMLAAMLKNANTFSPTRDMERAKGRQHVVLDRMHELGFIDDATLELEKNTPIQVTRSGNRGRQFADAPYFQSWVEQTLTDSPEIQISDPAPRSIDENDVKTSGLSIRMTLDTGLQQKASTALREGLSELNLELRKRAPRGMERNRPPVHGAIYYAQIVDATVPGAESAMRVKLPELPSKGDYANDKIYTIHYAPAETWLDDLNCLVKGVWFKVKAVANGEGFDFTITDDPHVQGALVAMDPHTGRVLAMQGGFDFTESNFNRCTQAYRQPGSGFKPILYSYALSFDPDAAWKRAENTQSSGPESDAILAAAKAGQVYGSFTPASILSGNPVVYVYGNQSYSPGNHDPGYGDATMRHALAASINIPAVRLLDDPRILMDDFLGYCMSLGFDRERLLQHADRTLPLGTLEVTPLQMTAAFSAFANGGIYNTPYFVDRILDRYGNIIYEHRPNAWRVLGEEEAFLITSIMNSVVTDPNGTAYSRISRNELLWSQAHSFAGKTGTTNNSTNAWFIGYSPDLVAAVYVGFDELQSLGSHVYGSGAALPTWIKFMESALMDKEPLKPFPMPTGIVTRRICPDSGLLSTSGCPHKGSGSAVDSWPIEYFKAGTEPVETCNLHNRERVLQMDGGFSRDTTLKIRS